MDILQEAPSNGGIFVVLAVSAPETAIACFVDTHAVICEETINTEIAHAIPEPCTAVAQMNRPRDSPLELYGD